MYMHQYHTCEWGDGRGISTPPDPATSKPPTQSPLLAQPTPPIGRNRLFQLKIDDLSTQADDLRTYMINIPFSLLLLYVKHTTKIRATCTIFKIARI